jgi:DNA repair protein RadC
MSEYKTLLAEITLKYKRDKSTHVSKIRNSKDAFELFLKFYDQDTIELTESCIVLFLDNSHKTLGWYKVSQGGLSETTVDIRLILGTALKCGASAIIISHNHPSASVQPSNADDRLTQKLNEGCKLLDMQLTDHIIVSSDLEIYYSYGDEGRV